MLMTITIRNHSHFLLGDGFVGDGEFALLGGGYLGVFYGCLVHEVMTGGDRSIFKIVSIGKDP